MSNTTHIKNPGEIDVGQLLDAGPWGGYQKFVLCLLALAYLVDGIANQSLGLAIPALMQDWKIDRGAFASVAAIGLVGLTIGAALGGMLGDRFGRKPMLIGSVFLFGIMTMAAGWADNVHQLFWMRFFDGLGMGAMIPNGAAMISETTPQRNRAVAIALAMVFIAVGNMVASLVAAIVLPVHGWEGHFIVLGALGILSALLFLFVLPESPMFLSRHAGKTERLRRVMARFGQPLPAQFLVVAKEEGAAQQGGGAGILFAPGVALSTIALWGAFFFCLLASYAVFSWVPAMLSDLGFPLALASMGMMVNGVGGVIGGVLSGWFIQRFGSKPAMLFCAAGSIISATMLGFFIHAGHQGLALIFGVLFLVGFFNANVHNGLYTLAAFIYPHHARGTGVGAAAAVGRIGAIVSSYVGVAALAIGGASGYFLVIALSMAIAFIGTALIRRHIAGTGPGARLSVAAPNPKASVAK